MGQRQTITNKNASQLTTKWVFPTTGDVSATASVVNGAVYFPDWGGFLYKVDAQTGLPIWSNPISNYTGMAGDVSRTTPAVDGSHRSRGRRRSGKSRLPSRSRCHSA